MSNIFKTELITPYACYPTRQGHGELVYHNGYWSMDIEPATFYNASLEPKSASILQNEFIPNIQYLFDMWVDADDCIYQDINRECGLSICYTDGTRANYIFVGDHTNLLGYQHKVFITPSNKSVQCINSYYWTSTPVYYRIDSIIIPVTNPDIKKTGIIESETFTETLNGVNKHPGIQKGNIFAEQFYEI